MTRKRITCYLFTFLIWSAGLMGAAIDLFGQNVSLPKSVIRNIHDADILFDQLQFDSAEVCYKSILTDYPGRDERYYRIINRLIESLWWKKVKLVV